MWKVIILSAFLSISQAVKTSDIYGTYTMVIGTPLVVGIPNLPPPACVKMSYAEDSRNVECTCSDGSNSTLVEMKLLEILPSRPSNFGKKSDISSWPLFVVGPETELSDAAVTSLFYVSCDCDGKEFTFRNVVKFVDNNYVQAYVYIRSTPYIDTDYVLLSRNLPTAVELEGDILRIDSEKAKNATVLCTQEIYEGLRPKN